jgi:hypothetical protein
MKRTQFIYSGVRGERTESGLLFRVNDIGYLCSNLNDVKDIVHSVRKEVRKRYRTNADGVVTTLFVQN